MNTGKSNIRQYLICHEADYDNNDDNLQEFPVKPNLDLTGNTNMVSAWAFRDIRGGYHEMLVNHSSAVRLELVCEGEDQLDDVNELIIDKIEEYGTRNFYVNLFLPTRGWYFSKWYFGTPYEAEVKYLDTTDGSKTIVVLKFDLIETDGTVVGA